MEIVEVLINAAVVLTALIAAILWIRAAKAEVEETDVSTVIIILDSKRLDMPRTMHAQAIANRRAANATGIAVLAQVAQYIYQNYQEVFIAIEGIKASVGL